jgi:HTH-type transcriptional regulator / antitoxin HigA
MSWAYKYDKEYIDLVKRFPLVPIRSRKQHGAALAAIDNCFSGNKLTKAESDYFHVLAQLIKNYEDETTEPVSITPQEALEFLMEQNDLTQAVIADISGMQKSHVSEFLAGKRGLPKNAAARLGARFKVDPMLFIPKVQALSRNTNN